MQVGDLVMLRQDLFDDRLLGVIIKKGQMINEEACEKIGFIDATTARLYGCRALTTLKMMHEGPYDHGIIAIKNRALSFGADMMVAGKMGEYKVGTEDSYMTISQFNVELYRCPESAFEEEKIKKPSKVSIINFCIILNLQEFFNGRG